MKQFNHAATACVTVSGVVPAEIVVDRDTGMGIHDEGSGDLAMGGCLGRCSSKDTGATFIESSFTNGGSAFTFTVDLSGVVGEVANCVVAEGIDDDGGFANILHHRVRHPHRGRRRRCNGSVYERSGQSPRNLDPVGAGGIGQSGYGGFNLDPRCDRQFSCRGHVVGNNGFAFWHMIGGGTTSTKDNVISTWFRHNLFVRENPEIPITAERTIITVFRGIGRPARDNKWRHG